MPEFIRALIVILALATVVFYFAKTPATAVAITPDDFVRRRNAWLYITLAGFLSQNFWVFVAIVSIVIYNAAKKDTNKIALFFFLVLALPQVKEEIPGFAGIRYFLVVDYVRVLTMVLLLPVCLGARRIAVSQRNKAHSADIVLATYILLNLALQAQYDVATNVVRAGLNWVMDVVIPYYAISRSIKDLKGFRDVLMSFVVAAMLASLVGVFEFTRNWILYKTVGQALGAVWDSGYLARGEYLRASATSGQAIVFGFVVAIAIGLYLSLRNAIPSRAQYSSGIALLLAGIFSPLSRGPWVGLVVMLFIYTALGEKPIQKYLKYSILVVPVIFVVAISDFGKKIVDYLPFVGSVDADNVTYRQNLFETSFQIILDNPFFGSTDYLLRMEDLRQGQGIIDLVNTFLIVGLNAGFVGLALYLLVFGLSIWGVFKRMRQDPIDSVMHKLGQSLIAVMLGILVIIATVSPIYHVPLMLWSVTALCLAYVRIGTDVR